jgi:hypothetical protein
MGSSVTKYIGVPALTAADYLALPEHARAEYKARIANDLQAIREGKAPWQRKRRTKRSPKQHMVPTEQWIAMSPRERQQAMARERIAKRAQ